MRCVVRLARFPLQSATYFPTIKVEAVQGYNVLNLYPTTWTDIVCLCSPLKTRKGAWELKYEMF